MARASLSSTFEGEGVDRNLGIEESSCQGLGSKFLATFLS